jgi:hypothetical protein
MPGYLYTLQEWLLNFFFQTTWKLLCLGGPLNDFPACCVTIVMCCAIDAKYENKEVGTVLNLIHKYLGTSVPLVLWFLLILFHNLFCEPTCSTDHLNEAHDHWWSVDHALGTYALQY